MYVMLIVSYERNQVDSGMSAYTGSIAMGNNVCV